MIYFMNLEGYNQWINDGCPINALITILDLSHANLTSVSVNIDKFTNLETLDLNNNQLTHLPESIGNLTGLIELDVSNNELTTLPESIGNLSNLEELDVHNNQLTRLPRNIDNLPNLFNINTRNNPIINYDLNDDFDYEFTEPMSMDELNNSFEDNGPMSLDELNTDVITPIELLTTDLPCITNNNEFYLDICLSLCFYLIQYLSHLLRLICH